MLQFFQILKIRQNRSDDRRFRGIADPPHPSLALWFSAHATRRPRCSHPPSQMNACSHPPLPMLQSTITHAPVIFHRSQSLGSRDIQTSLSRSPSANKSSPGLHRPPCLHLGLMSSPNFALIVYTSFVESGFDEFGYRRSSLCPSSSLRFYECRGLFVGHSPISRAILRNSDNYNLSASLCIKRKHVGKLWTYHLQQELNWPCFDYELNKRNKLQRHTVVRSELVGNGIPNSSYSLSDNLSASLCIKRKHVGKLWTYHLQQELNWPCFDYELNKRNKLQRHTVVRSELVGNGIPNSSYSLSESKLGSKVRGVCFYVVTAIAAIFLFVLMLVQHPFVLLFDRYQRKAQFFIAKIWALLTVSPFFRIKYEGLENLPPPNAPAVYVSNHQSYLDIYTLLTLGRSFKFISKTGIFLFPIIGWAMFMLGVIPLKRMDSRSQLECLKQCIELVKKGASVLFFPEGTRSKDGKLGTFKKGAFSVAAKTKVPVVPITLVGTGEIMPSGMEGILNFGSVRVVVHKPVEGSDPEVLCKEVRNKIASVLEQQS